MDLFFTEKSLLFIILLSIFLSTPHWLLMSQIEAMYPDQHNLRRPWKPYLDSTLTLALRATRVVSDRELSRPWAVPFGGGATVTGGKACTLYIVQHHRHLSQSHYVWFWLFTHKGEKFSNVSLKNKLSLRWGTRCNFTPQVAQFTLTST